MAPVETPAPERTVFAERPTEPIVRDALALAAPPLLVAGAAALAGWGTLALWLAVAAAAVVGFFRNPSRALSGDEHCAVAPADGRVIEVGEEEAGDGGKALRIAIFLSVFDVHVNRFPLAGRVVSVERSGGRFRAAFDRRAERDNARCAVTVETQEGVRFQVVQIAGLLARRIVCHVREGDQVRRGDRYGLIRFGSRTDVWLPAGSVPRVRRGDRVRGGASVLAELRRTQ